MAKIYKVTSYKAAEAAYSSCRDVGNGKPLGGYENRFRLHPVAQGYEIRDRLDSACSVVIRPDDTALIRVKTARLPRGGQAVESYLHSLLSRVGLRLWRRMKGDYLVLRDSYWQTAEDAPTWVRPYLIFPSHRFATHWYIDGRKIFQGRTPNQLFDGAIVDLNTGEVLNPSANGNRFPKDMIVNHEARKRYKQRLRECRKVWATAAELGAFDEMINEKRGSYQALPAAVHWVKTGEGLDLDVIECILAHEPYRARWRKDLSDVVTERAMQAWSRFINYRRDTLYEAFGVID